MIGPLVFFTFTLLAVHYAPWFSWTEHALSYLAGDVGERPIWAARGTPSILFNSGLIITGILGTLFAFGLRKTQKTPSGRLGGTLLILSMFALCSNAIFPLPLGLPHSIASYCLFMLAPFALSVLGAGYLDSYQKPLGIFSLVIAIVAAVGLFVVPTLAGWTGYAIPEMILAIALSVCSTVIGAKMVKQSYTREK